MSYFEGSSMAPLWRNREKKYLFYRLVYKGKEMGKDEEKIGQDKVRHFCGQNTRCCSK